MSKSAQSDDSNLSKHDKTVSIIDTKNIKPSELKRRKNKARDSRNKQRLSLIPQSRKGRRKGIIAPNKKVKAQSMTSDGDELKENDAESTKKLTNISGRKSVKRQGRENDIITGLQDDNTALQKEKTMMKRKLNQTVKQLNVFISNYETESENNTAQLKAIKDAAKHSDSSSEITLKEKLEDALNEIQRLKQENSGYAALVKELEKVRKENEIYKNVFKSIQINMNEVGDLQ